jgi:hypothetical protein
LKQKQKHNQRHISQLYQENYNMSESSPTTVTGENVPVPKGIDNIHDRLVRVIQARGLMNTDRPPFLSREIQINSKLARPENEILNPEVESEGFILDNTYNLAHTVGDWVNERGTRHFADETYHLESDRISESEANDPVKLRIVDFTVNQPGFRLRFICYRIQTRKKKYKA